VKEDFPLFQRQILIYRCTLRLFILYFVNFILVEYKDGEGGKFIVKDKNGWKVSKCLNCHIIIISKLLIRLWQGDGGLQTGHHTSFGISKTSNIMRSTKNQSLTSLYFIPQVEKL